MAATDANASASPTERAVDSKEVGMIFVHEYYTILHNEPSRLHCFYNKGSIMSHGTDDGEPVVSIGQQASDDNQCYQC